MPSPPADRIPSLNHCKICKSREATVPEGEERARYCEHCWDNRLRQLYQAADNFRAERVFRTADSEKYFIFHSSVKEEDGFCAIVFCLHDPHEDHLDVTAYLLEVLKWEDTVPIIYEEGVESEVELMDVFLWFLEGDVIRSWRSHSWSAEVSHCSRARLLDRLARAVRRERPRRRRRRAALRAGMTEELPSPSPSPDPAPLSAPQPRREHVIWGTLGAVVLASLVAVAAEAIVDACLGTPDGVTSPPGLFTTLVLTSGGFAACALWFARRGPGGLRRRLLLVRPAMSGRELWLLVPATWAVWLAGIPLLMLGTWLFGEGDGMQFFTATYGSAPWPWKVAFLAASTLGPGIGEELLFRGYLQQGLLGNGRGPRFALILTAVLFSAAHFPPARMLFVLPLAFWLGFLAHRTGSLVPGMLCHTFVNLTGHSLLATDVNPLFVFVPVFILGVPAFVMSVRFFRSQTLARSSWNAETSSFEAV